MEVEQTVRACADEATGRVDLWRRLVESIDARTVAEVGVYRGEFASALLAACPRIDRYVMIDPWRHLADWNKPANEGDDRFEGLHAEAMARTDFAEDRRLVLRGTTAEVSDRVPDGSVDVVYVDGDHTLRGITIDLVRMYPKVRTGGWIGGDDFVPDVWQHSTAFEPTLVFPFAVHFAEAVDQPVVALPFGQFLIGKDREGGFAFHDLTGRFGDTALRRRLLPGATLKGQLKRRAARLLGSRADRR